MVESKLQAGPWQPSAFGHRLENRMFATTKRTMSHAPRHPNLVAGRNTNPCAVRSSGSKYALWTSRSPSSGPLLPTASVEAKRFAFSILGNRQGLARNPSRWWSVRPICYAIGGRLAGREDLSSAAVRKARRQPQITYKRLTAATA